MYTDEASPRSLVAPPPASCPGTNSEQAGKASSCAGCPNEKICSSGAAPPQDPAVAQIAARLAPVRRKIVVLSGKGGVGKSTVTACLAHAFSLSSAASRGMAGFEGPLNPNANENINADENEFAPATTAAFKTSPPGGLRVGVLDIDITGPSIPRLLGVVGEGIHVAASGWSPVDINDRLCCMSIGFLLSNQDDAVIWRAPKKTAIIKQFLRDVDWGALDVLLIDTPPGTSDEHIALVQMLAGAGIDGAIVVTTPQELSLQDVRKELAFCRKVGLPVLGVVENMASFVCPSCSHCSEIFAAWGGGAGELCRNLGLPLLARVPLDPALVRCCDAGRSPFTELPKSLATKAYLDLAAEIGRIIDFGARNCAENIQESNEDIQEEEIEI